MKFEMWKYLLPMMLASCATALQADRVGCVDCPEMVVLHPGTFIAGSPKAETDAVHMPDVYSLREHPQHEVRIDKAYAIGRYEVTRGEYARFVADTGRGPDGPCSTLVDGPNNVWKADAGRTWDAPGFDQTVRSPVVCVSYADANAYAAWLSAKTGTTFRLPSGPEWEYAARGGSNGARWFGDTADVCRYASVSDLSRAKAHNNGEVDPEKFFACNDGYVFTAPVGSFAPNPYGLYDILGNVWEWTLDCLNATQENMASDPSPMTTGDCSSHIDRGGSWTNSPKYLRAATHHPDLNEARNTVLGFRLVQELR